MSAPPALDDEATAVVDATLPLLGIAIEPDWRAAIVANVRVTTAAARLVLEFPLDDEFEPAPVFSA